MALHQKHPVLDEPFDCMYPEYRMQTHRQAAWRQILSLPWQTGEWWLRHRIPCGVESRIRHWAEITWHVCDYENQEWPRVPDRKISVDGDMLWHNPNRGVGCQSMSPETDIFRFGTRGHSWFFFSLNIDNKMHFVSISIAFWRLTHLYVIPTRIKKVPIKPSASYLDLLLSIGRDCQLHTSFYDKRDDFNFQITNFPFLSSNIPSSPAYGVFISQLIRYARACSSYECFILRARRLSSKLLNQGYLVERLKSSFRKFYGRYGDLVEQYGVTLSRMLNDILTLDQQWPPYRSDFAPISWPLYRAWPSPNYEWFPWSIRNGCG